MGLNETFKGVLLQQYHEFASKTRLGRAAQKIWVKHQFVEKGILNPANYTQQQMDTFYGIIAANYIHLHETYPQTFSTDRVYDRELLGLPEGKEITHADLYLHRVIEKARTIEFRPITTGSIEGLAFSTGMMVDDQKTSDTRMDVLTFFRSGQYLTDPNCPKAFSTILQSSTFGLTNALGYILSSKETREEFLADPKGFLTSRFDSKNHQLTPEQQQSFFAMMSPTFVEAIRSNEQYIASVETRQAEQNLKEVISHEAYHLGMIAANKDLREETLEQSYAKTDAIAGRDRSVSKERSSIAQLPENARARLEASDKAINEIYVDLLASRTVGTPTVLNHYTQATGNVYYTFNATTACSYTINEPIFALLENMVNCMDGSTVAIHNYLSGVVPSSKEQEREFLSHHPLFSQRSAFNIIGRNGKLSIPDQFKGTISEPKLYTSMTPFQTFCALTNNILTTRQLASENKTPVNVMPMVQQAQTMLLTTFQNQEVSSLAARVASIFEQGPTNEEMLTLLREVSNKEEMVQQMFTNLVFTRDDSRSISECKQFITSTYGKGTTLSSVLQSAKTVEEIQALIDNGIILESANLTSYMTTLSNMQSIREIVETSIITANPNLNEEQIVALAEISNPYLGIDMDSIYSNFTASIQQALGIEPTTETAPDPTAVVDPPVDETLVADSTTIADADKIDTMNIDTTTATATEVAVDVGGCDMGGDYPSE